jgi:hypothetical protein
MLISSSCHIYAYMRFIGAYTCNRCTEKRDDGKVPQDVLGGVGASSGAGGSVRRNPRRRRNCGWALNLEPSSYDQGKPRSIISLLLSKQLIIYTSIMPVLTLRWHLIMQITHKKNCLPAQYLISKDPDPKLSQDTHLFDKESFIITD